MSHAMSIEQLKTTADAELHTEADRLVKQVERRLRDNYARGVEGCMMRVSGFSPAAQQQAAEDLMAAGWMVHYGWCSRGTRFSVPITVFDVMTKQDYLRRTRESLEFDAKGSPFFAAFFLMVAIAVVACVIAPGLATGGKLIDAGIAVLLAVIGWVYAVRNVRRKTAELPLLLASVTVPTYPIHNEVSWSKWWYYNHPNG